jgi:hypothetical protein
MREKFDCAPEGIDVEAEIMEGLKSIFSPGTVFFHKQIARQGSRERRWLTDDDTIPSGWVKTGNTFSHGQTLRVEPVAGEPGMIWRYYHDDNGTEVINGLPASKVKGKKIR